MLSKEEMRWKLTTAHNMTNQEAIDIIRSYIFLRKNIVIDIIEPRNDWELQLMKSAIGIILRWTTQ